MRFLCRVCVEWTPIDSIVEYLIWSHEKVDKTDGETRRREKMQLLKCQQKKYRKKSSCFSLSLSDSAACSSDGVNERPSPLPSRAKRWPIECLALERRSLEREKNDFKYSRHNNARSLSGVERARETKRAKRVSLTHDW